MPKPDKLPVLDPNVRGIFDRLIATAAQVRKDRRTHEFKEAERREEQQRGDRARMREREALEKVREAEAKAARLEREVTTPAFLELQPGQPLLSLRR